jgi:hypothetical protein
MISLAPVSQRRRRTLVFGLLVIACGDPTRPPDITPCFIDPVEVSVGAGTVPEISWTPACGISALAVEEVGAAAPESTKWRVHRSQTLLQPPVRYGSPPNGSTDVVEVPATSLETGRTYRVILFTQALFEFSEIGSATFTP